MLGQQLPVPGAAIQGLGIHPQVAGRRFQQKQALRQSIALLPRHLGLRRQQHLDRRLLQGRKILV
jgi:hypothetical protein